MSAVSYQLMKANVCVANGHRNGGGAQLANWNMQLASQLLFNVMKAMAKSCLHPT